MSSDRTRCPSFRRRTRTGHGHFRDHQGNSAKTREGRTLEIPLPHLNSPLSFSLYRNPHGLRSVFADKRNTPTCRYLRDIRMNRYVSRERLYQRTCGMRTREIVPEIRNRDRHLCCSRNPDRIYHSPYPSMKRFTPLAISTASGALFGFGLTLSDMLSPARIQ